MRFPFLLLLVALVPLGCAETSISKRKQERMTAFASLPANQQSAVEQGRLLHGMSTNAAYIAWGRPSQIIAEGTTTRWIYREQAYKEHTHTTIRITRSGGHSEEITMLYPDETTRAHVTFENGLIKEWKAAPLRSRQLFQ